VNPGEAISGEAGVIFDGFSVDRPMGGTGFNNYEDWVVNDSGR